MKRPIQHVMEDQSEQLFRSFLPAEWIARPVLKDYGVDQEVELVDQESVSGNRIWIQLKATNGIRFSQVTYHVGEMYPEIADADGKITVEYAAFPISTKELHYSLKNAFPLLLFVADLERNDVFWIPIRDEIIGGLSIRNPKWSSQKPFEYYDLREKFDPGTQ